MSVVPDLNVKIHSKLLHLAAMQMDGFCECPHAVPPILVCLRAFAELLVRPVQQLEEVEYCFILEKLWCAMQSRAVFEQAAKIVPPMQFRQHSDQGTGSVLHLMVGEIVYEYMRSYYLPKHAPHLLSRLDAQNHYDLGYMRELDFDGLALVNGWIEQDRIPVAEFMVLFSVLWDKRRSLAVSYIGLFTNPGNHLLVQQVQDYTLDVRHRHSILPYTKKTTALIFEAPTVS